MSERYVSVARETQRRARHGSAMMHEQGGRGGVLEGPEPGLLSGAALSWGEADVGTLSWPLPAEDRAGPSFSGWLPRPARHSSSLGERRRAACLPRYRLAPLNSLLRTPRGKGWRLAGPWVGEPALTFQVA